MNSRITIELAKARIEALHREADADRLAAVAAAQDRAGMTPTSKLAVRRSSAAPAGPERHA
jgi:hypothetical protein